MQSDYSFPSWSAIESVCDFLVLWISLNHESRLVLSQPGCMSHMISGFCEPGLSTASNFTTPFSFSGLLWQSSSWTILSLWLVFDTISTNYNIHLINIHLDLIYSRSSRCRRLASPGDSRIFRFSNSLYTLLLAPSTQSMTFSRSKNKTSTEPTQVSQVGWMWKLLVSQWLSSLNRDNLETKLCQDADPTASAKDLPQISWNEAYSAVHHDTSSLKSLAILHCPELFRTLFRLLVFNYFILCGWKLMTCPWTIYWTNLDANRTWYRVWSLEPSNWKPQIFPWVPKSLVSVKENSRGKGCLIFHWVF